MQFLPMTRSELNLRISEALLDQFEAHQHIVAAQNMAMAAEAVTRAIDRDGLSRLESEDDQMAVSVAGDIADARNALHGARKSVESELSERAELLRSVVLPPDKQAEVLAEDYLKATEAYRRGGGQWWDAVFILDSYFPIDEGAGAEKFAPSRRSSMSTAGS